jgi:CBS domain-containing protein
MSVVQVDKKSQITELTSASFEQFCFDVSSMLAVEMNCSCKEPVELTFEQIRSRFKGYVSFNFVKTEGLLNGRFALIVDQRGLFVTAGTFVMLPEERIKEASLSPSQDDIAHISDAVSEVGNLLVGSWDKIFRENASDHGHFVQGQVYIEKLSDANQDSPFWINRPCTCIECEITLEQFPSFVCIAVFPENVFEEPLEIDTQVEPQVTEEEQIDSEQPQQEVQVTKEAPQEHVHTAEISPETDNIIVADIMRKEITWKEPDNTVHEAMITMQEQKDGYVLVGDGQIMEGIVSHGDILAATSIYLKEGFEKFKRPLDEATMKIKLRWIMSQPVITIEQNASINDIMTKMTSTGKRCLVVTDEQSSPVGIITVFDIFKSLTAKKD